jgi:nucleoid-associated protein YejK
MSKGLVLASESQAKQIRQAADDYMATTTMWNETYYAVHAGIAEYIANQHGLTLYYSRSRLVAIA